MSVLIKNMEMPRHCGECSLLCSCDDCYFCGYEDSLLYTFGDAYNIPGERPDKCPLTEVPTPHGRLIDADEFIKKHNFGYECDGCIFDEECNYDFSFTRMEICSWIEDAPTVIEADNK